MFRSRDQRQSESAHKYLDFAAVSPALENAAEVTARALDFPVALVNILDDCNQYTLVAHGSDAVRGQVIPRSSAACDAVVEQGRPIVVQDVDSPNGARRSTARAFGNPTDSLLKVLRESGLRAYASIPLFGRESVPIGTLCILDVLPRTLSPEKFRLLEQLAVMVEEHLDTQRDRARVAANPATSSELTAAVDNGQITPWYEPIVDLHTSGVFALEALARWEHPTRGLLTPGEFIEQVENTDLIVDLDLRILSRALSDFVKWHLDRPGLKLSVNISGHHLERLDCVDRIVSAVHASGVSPKSVVLEVTETARGAGVDDEARIVAALRSSGFTVLLDDLGSGWSPIPRITHVTVDGFKLDRALAASLHTKIGEAVAHAMLQFAGELDHCVVLEGVENMDRLGRARTLGFTHGQGHLFSTAMNAEDVPRFLYEWSAQEWPRLDAERS
ncbi:MAG: sensor domain-containing phosphodiesterase [Rhodococcus sp. (in: high G+C Gram-positive bacteria)]|nr:EAL domain-containing protein [uncultured Rhodococcus sp.]